MFYYTIGSICVFFQVSDFTTECTIYKIAGSDESGWQILAEQSFKNAFFTTREMFKETRKLIK